MEPTSPHHHSPFARYARLEFSDHLRQATSQDPGLSKKLSSFLECNILRWIEFVAETGHLSILAKAANSINAYLQRHIRSSSPLGEFVHLTQNWVVDLHHIVAASGHNLLEYPSAIYSLIPPFCPRSSAIATTAGSHYSRMTVRGLKDEGWNDRLSCIDSQDKLVVSVACGDMLFAIGYIDGTIVLRHNSTCLPWKSLDGGPTALHLMFEDGDRLVVAGGRRTISAWDMDKGIRVWTVETRRDIMSINITENGKTLMAADKSGHFSRWNMESGALRQTISWSGQMPFTDEGTFRRPPLLSAFSPDSSLVAVVYRGKPVCLYDLEDKDFHGLVSRERDPMSQGLGANTSPTALVFNTRKDNLHPRNGLRGRRSLHLSV